MVHPLMSSLPYFCFVLFFCLNIYILCLFCSGRMDLAFLSRGSLLKFRSSLSDEEDKFTNSLSTSSKDLLCSFFST